MKKSFTMADMEKAVVTLRAANVPPAECRKCGEKFYVANPEIIGGIFSREEDFTLCAECDVKRLGETKKIRWRW